MINDRLRREQIAEALEDLEAVFAEPGCFGDCSLEDAAVSFESEFITPYKDGEISHRVSQLIEADQRGRHRAALTHLRAIRRHVRTRWATEGASDAAKEQVAAMPSRPVSPQTPRVDHRTGRAA